MTGTPSSAEKGGGPRSVWAAPPAGAAAGAARAGRSKTV
jgi:hypothetical protein